MKQEAQIKKAGRRINLWQLLLAIVVVSMGLGLLPQGIGAPIFLVFEGTLIVSLLLFLMVAVFKRLAKK